MKLVEIDATNVPEDLQGHWVETGGEFFPRIFVTPAIPENCVLWTSPSGKHHLFRFEGEEFST